MGMSPISADEARRLREAATPGPWHWVNPLTDEPVTPVGWEEEGVHDPVSLRSVATRRRRPDGYDLPVFIVHQTDEVSSSADAALIAAAPDLAAEVERLSSWKQEAIQVIAEWEKIFESLGRPGRLGESKAVASRREVECLQAENERLRKGQ